MLISGGAIWGWLRPAPAKQVVRSMLAIDSTEAMAPSTSRPGRTWSHCLGRIDRQHGPHYLLRRCGAQPTPDRATRNQHGEHDHGVQHRPVATAVLFALWRGSNDGRRDRWSVRRHSKVHGRADRGTAQRRGEILDLGIGLHLELLSHEFLINPGVLYRAGAVSGGREREPRS